MFTFKDVPLHSAAWAKLKKKLEKEAKCTGKTFVWTLYLKDIEGTVFETMQAQRGTKKVTTRKALVNHRGGRGPREVLVECVRTPTPEARYNLLGEASEGFITMVRGALI